MADLNPQRLLFKEYYCNPTSDTFNLIKESALKAGFSKSYAKVLMSDSTDNDWVKNIINNYKLKKKAERNLEKFLDDDKNVAIQADITKFTLKNLGGDDYSDKLSIKGEININPEAKEQANKAINSFLNDNTRDTTIG